MSPRRRRRALTPEEQIARDEKIAEEKIRDKKIGRQRNYAVKQKKAFYEEYCAICKKYGCYMGGLNGSYVTKVWPREKIRTIKSHLESADKFIADPDRPFFYN